MLACLMLLAPLNATAGDLTIEVEPVTIHVNGRVIPVDPVTGRAKLRGVRGRHMVEVRAPSGAVLARSEVRVGPRQTVRLVFDGSNMAPLPLEPVPVELPAPVGPEPMDPGTFRLLVSEVDKLSFPDDKLSALELAARGAWFTTEQVGTLIDQMSYGDDKVAVVKLLRNQIVDMDRAFTLASHFDFSSDAEEAMDLLKSVR